MPRENTEPLEGLVLPVVWYCVVVACVLIRDVLWEQGVGGSNPLAPTIPLGLSDEDSGLSGKLSGDALSPQSSALSPHPREEGRP